MYSYIEAAESENTGSITLHSRMSALSILSNRDAQNMQDSCKWYFCGLIFTDTSPYHVLSVVDLLVVGLVSIQNLKSYTAVLVVVDFDKWTFHNLSFTQYIWWLPGCCYAAARVFWLL